MWALGIPLFRWLQMAYEPLGTIHLSTLVTTFGSALKTFLYEHGYTLFAPILWAALIVSALPRWRAPHPIDWPATRRDQQARVRVPGTARMTRRERRKQIRTSNRECARPAVKRTSIRTAGLHRKYPLNLRALGRFVRRSEAPTYEARRVREEIQHLHNLIQIMRTDIRLLQRHANTRNMKEQRHVKSRGHAETTYSRGPSRNHVPGMRREGGNTARNNNRTGIQHAYQDGPWTRHAHDNRLTVNRPASRPPPGQNIRRSPATTAPVVPGNPWVVPNHRIPPYPVPDRPVSVIRTPPYGMGYAPRTPRRTPRQTQPSAYILDLAPPVVERVFQPVAQLVETVSQPLAFI